MEELLHRLMTRLEEAAGSHPELYDTEVRDHLAEALLRGFVEQEADFEVPAALGLFTDEGNEAVRRILQDYLREARARAETLGLDREGRQAALWNYDVATDEGQYADDFFGSL
jgi:hypothetical protein